MNQRIWSLTELCTMIQYGYTASASSDAIGPKFLRITDIVPDLINWESVPYCGLSVNDREKYLLSDGDIVIARTGATTGYAKQICAPPEAVFASYLIRIRINEELADPRFVGIMIQSAEYKKFVQSHWGGAAQPNANAKTLTGYKLSLPERSDQERIVEVLFAYDDLIAANHRRIQLLEESARLLYREWFVKMRFPGHETTPVRPELVEGRFDEPLHVLRLFDKLTAQHERHEVPAEWVTCKLSEVADVNSSSVTAKDHPESIRYVDISSVEIGEIGKVDEIFFEKAPGRARRRVQHGDIIWSCVRPNRRSYALIWEPQDNLIVSTGFAVITARTIPFSYLYLASTTDDFVNYLTNQATGAAYPAVTAKDFEKASILLPDTKTLAAFDQIVLPMLEQIDAIKCQNNILRQARDLLLPKLMSGVLDVSRIAVPREVEV